MNNDLEEATIIAEEKAFECNECGAGISADDDVCPVCGNDVSETTEGDDEPELTAIAAGNPVLYRYLDLYRSARLLVAIGSTVKLIGIVLGVVILALSLFAGASTSSLFGVGALGVAGAIYGALVGGFIFLLGTLIAAQGQIMFVQADSAVHTSPFMTDEEKAKVMSLPFRRRREKIGEG